MQSSTVCARHGHYKCPNPPARPLLSSDFVREKDDPTKLSYAIFEQRLMHLRDKQGNSPSHTIRSTPRLIAVPIDADERGPLEEMAVLVETKRPCPEIDKSKVLESADGMPPIGAHGLFASAPSAVVSVTWRKRLPRRSNQRNPSNNSLRW